MLIYIVKYFMGFFFKLGVLGCLIGKKKGKVFFKIILCVKIGILYINVLESENVFLIVLFCIGCILIKIKI